ncbi:MAG: ASKHA domain-containing protein [Dehalococcoidia bacterium]
MAKHRVTFLPDRKEIEVEEGLTLLEAADKAGVYVNSLCGGEGNCGECRVQVISGNARADKHTIGFLSKEEIRDGYVLACQTKVEDNLEIMIPPKSRLEEEQIISEGAPVTYSEPEKISLHRRPYDPASSFDPLVTKVYLELPEPTLDDNISDIDRVTRGLSKKVRYPSFEISLACLQDLADKLRQNRWAVTVTVAWHNGIGRILDIKGGDTTNRNYGLAIDVGTTTVVVQLIDLNTGKVLGVEASHNLQARYGEDVISRMVFACSRGSLEALHGAVIANINNLTQTLSQEKGIDTRDIAAIVAAGNTTMSHFLLGLMPCSIRLEPYVPTTTTYPQIRAKEVGIDIHPQAILEVMPNVASYVGGDIVAGVLACGLTDGPEIKCLIDVGTNGEIAIGNNDWIVCCSASAGPAFEGGGAKSGMRATKGAVEKIEIRDGQLTYETIAGARPRGICGSGFIDAIYELVSNKIIDRDGKFNPLRDDRRMIAEDNERRYVLAFPEETETGQAVTISEPEISSLTKAKGAVFAAIKCLIDYVGLSFENLDTIYVSGGFGSSLNIPKAIGIGLLPDIDTKKIQFIGNSSIMGARMALVSRPDFEKAIAIAKRMTNIELSNYPPFMNEFVAALFLPHTHRDLFPSVHY